MPAPGFGLPADPPVLLVLDHMVVHLVVADMGEVHLHHEDVSHARDHRGGTRSPQTLRAIELRMPQRIGEDLEDVVRWSADPPRYGNRLVLIVSHETYFPSPGQSPPGIPHRCLTTGKTQDRSAIHRPGGGCPPSRAYDGPCGLNVVRPRA